VAKVGFLGFVKNPKSPKLGILGFLVFQFVNLTWYILELLVH